MRRDCDGDEAGFMLMMDAFLNFSRQFLPDHRGANQDEPLVLTSKLIPTEVDDMVFDMDIVWKYPLEFYEACLNWEYPWDQKILRFGQVLGTEKQYEGMGYTHEVSDFNAGVRCSSYKTIPTMQEKVMGQMALAEKIRAVDEVDAASLVIERHFIRDIKGNLRKFSMQQFRCVDCNEKYRRPPLVGHCTKCGGKIIFTIAEGSVIKYMEPSLSLADKYDLPPYLKQTLELTKQRIESVFGKDPDKQEGLGKWFAKT
jgi:DNA polymerase II large subunit